MENGEEENVTKKRYIPRKELKANQLKRALKTYIIPIVSNKYHSLGIRVLWTEEKDCKTMWEHRLKLESMLCSIKEIVLFFSCVTASDGEDNSMHFGFSFWISFDWTAYGLETFENLISKKFMEAGLCIHQCKSLRSRGKMYSVRKYKDILYK